MPGKRKRPVKDPGKYQWKDGDIKVTPPKRKPATKQPKGK